jgi:two-component system cell cycle response regulator
MNPETKNRSRILIAEDDSVSRHLLRSFLVKWGYDVVTAADGVEALKILESESAPSLAVLDWMMPGLEGPQVCQRVRTQPDRPYTYVLLLTARSQKNDLLTGLESGADDYLTKPFDAQELRARLHVGRRILDLQDTLIATREELRVQATHDPLTSVYNRSVALNALDREHARKIRNEGGSFGVLLADVDLFKNVNDTHGHLFGDAVLKEVTQRMVRCVRNYDTVGRYGGEEFLIIAPDLRASNALVLAERIRIAIEEKPVVTDAATAHVTVSIGVAASDADRFIDPETILNQADEALYRAKKLGRNRCELASVNAHIVLQSAAIPSPDQP